MEQAEATLRRLDALDAAGNVTELGKAMARLPIHPRLGRVLLEGLRLGRPEEAALAAALLSERDPFARVESVVSDRRPVSPPSNSDILDRMAALEAFEQSGNVSTPLGLVKPAAARFVLHARDQLLREVRRAGGWSPGFSRSDKEQPSEGETPTTADEAVRRALLAAFPDRLARRTSSGSRFGRMVGGRGVRLAATSAVRGAPLFLAVDVDQGSSEALVWQASAIERAWLPAERLSHRTDVEFDRDLGRVVARRRSYWEDLLLEETPEALPDSDEVARILAAAAAESFTDVFPWDDRATADYVKRVPLLRQWMPELGLPALDEHELQSLLGAVSLGCRSFDDLRKVPWLEHIHGLLTPEQQRVLRREAPERILVPSGNRILLRYEPGKPPVLAVRIQEVFGLLETPRVAGGRVAVLLHLLAPNMRPQQVTDDLASFWKTTYHQVRKDLRRRYPKHAWPEDPLEKRS